MKKRSVPILAVCLLCASLGTGCSSTPSHKEERAETRSSSNATATPQAAPDNRPVIVTFGDSLTAGVAGRSYPDDLQDLLDRSGYRYRVDNQGVSGDTTTDGLARIQNVTAEHPALVILEFGGNDGLRGVPVNSIRTNLEEMIKQVKEAKIPLVLLGITLPPNYGADYVKSFTAMYPAIANKYHLRFLPFLLIDVYQHADMMQPDGIHPNGKGNVILAQDVFQLVRPLLTISHRNVK